MVADPVAHAVVLLNVAIAGGVPSTGELVATPVKLDPAMLRPPTALAEKVAVIVVPDARPEGAGALTFAMSAPPPGIEVTACLSIVHVKLPPETPVTVCPAALLKNAPTSSVMNPLAATAWVVVKAMLLAAESIAAEPMVSLSTTMDTVTY
jgi:hypothetical protein